MAERKVRRFVCNKCGKRIVTMARFPVPCKCDPKSRWIPTNLYSNEYEQRRDGWRRKQPKLKISKKQRRERRREYKEAIHAVGD